MPWPPSCPLRPSVPASGSCNRAMGDFGLPHIAHAVLCSENSQASWPGLLSRFVPNSRRSPRPPTNYAPLKQASAADA